MSKLATDAYLVALGGNLVPEGESLVGVMQSAIEAVRALPVRITAVSRMFRTPAYPAGAGPDFVNAALSLETALSAQDLMARLHDIEADFGRQRRARWQARSLDLDLLAAGQAVLPDADVHDHWRNLGLSDQMRQTPPDLILPHPRMQDRAFVLVPLCDVAPDWRHPRLNLTVAEMCAALPAADRDSVVPLAESACQ